MKAKIKINKLKKALQLVKDGKFVHITCFNLIGYFFKSNPEEFKARYMEFLLNKNYNQLFYDQSLNVDHGVVSNLEKLNLYSSTLRCLISHMADEAFEKRESELENILQEIRRFYPLGWRRIYIRATRRKIFDVDLLLLNRCVLALQTKYISHYDLIEMTKYFCIDYANLRFKLNEKSISRFEKVIEFFENNCVNHSPVLDDYIFISDCPICGCVGQFSPPYKTQTDLMCSYDICRCCGFEFGLDDENTYFEEWLADGAEWLSEKYKPENWSLDEQLENKKKVVAQLESKNKNFQNKHQHDEQ